MTNPLVSIIIPTHNRASMLGEAITSAVAQPYRPIEILVADDGSTDGTSELIAGFGDVVRHVRLDHSGCPSTTRNRALDRARGDFIAFLDDDDRWHPTKLGTQMDTIRQDDSIGLVFTNGCFLSAEGQVSAPVFSPPVRHGNMFSSLLRDCFIHPSTVLVRKSVLDQAGWFDETFTTAEDWELWLRIARITQMTFLPESLVTIRKHRDQVSERRQRQTLQNMERILMTWRAQSGLSIADRIRIRRTLAKTYNHLAVCGGGTTAMLHHARAIRWNPLTRAGWRGLMRSVLPPRSHTRSTQETEE